MSDTPPQKEKFNTYSEKNSYGLYLFLFVIPLLFFGVLVLMDSFSAHPESQEPLVSKIFSRTDESHTPSPQPEKYKSLINEVKTQRLALFEKYQNSNNKAAVIQEARDYLHEKIPRMMRCWIGTPWDFNGTSQTPGKGKIACGYFVSVILRDAGFKVNRITLAQQASQNILLSMIHTEDKVINPRRDYDAFIKYFKGREEGIYIIGLDSHVGFLCNLNGEVHFLHSGAQGVIDETLAEARDIKVSRYRVIGNVTGQDYVIEKWLKGEKFPTRK